MKKEEKKKDDKNKHRPNKYEDKLAVKGSFIDIMKAAAKNANNKKKP